MIECRDALCRLRNRTYMLERLLVQSGCEEFGVEAGCMLAIENYQDIEKLQRLLSLDGASQRNGAPQEETPRGEEQQE